MKEEKTKSIILYLLKIAQEKKISIGRVRLMKLLYLLDVEYHRHYGKKYTDLEWILYKYGPFAFEVESLYQKVGITEEEIPLKEERIFKQLKYENMGFEDVTLPIEPRSILERLFKEWGSADLNRLLDFVYFDTEPMEGAELRKKLDFSRIIPHRKNKENIVSSDIKRKLRVISCKIKQRLDRIEAFPTISSSSPQDIEITSIWDKGEVTKLTFLKGIVRLGKKEKERWILTK